MRNRYRVAAAAVAMSLCGVVLAPPAMAKKKAKPPASRFEGWDEGGAVGCSNGPVRDRAGRVVQRIGGGNQCGEEKAPQPIQQPATKAWLVGVWVSANQCAGAEFPVRLRKDGSYERLSDAGTWTLANNAITFTYRDTSAAGGEFITADMERSLPVESNTIKIRRLADGRLTYGSYTLRRCSTDPDAEL